MPKPKKTENKERSLLPLKATAVALLLAVRILTHHQFHNVHSHNNKSLSKKNEAISSTTVNDISAKWQSIVLHALQFKIYENMLCSIA